MKERYTGIFEDGYIEKARRENPFINVTNEVAWAIEDAVLTMKLEPGEKLNIRQLAAALGVSTTTIRDAFSILEKESMLDVVKEEEKAHREYRVRSIDDQDIEDLFVVRRAIESESAYLCAKWMDRPDIPFLEKTVRQIEEGIDEIEEKRESSHIRKLSEIDRQFHEALVEYAGNPYLNETYQSVRKNLKYLSYQTSSSLFMESKKRLRLIGHQHRAVLNAIRLGFPQQAHEQMNEHLDFCMNAVTRLTP